LLSWDVSSISSSAIVESAQIILQVLDKSATSFPVFAINRQWDERQATWMLAAQGSNWGTSGAQNISSDRGNTQIGVLNTSGKGSATITLSATGISLVQSWIENPAANFGIIIQNYTGSAVAHIASREAKTVAQRPKLSVTYSMPTPPVAVMSSTSFMTIEPFEEGGAGGGSASEATLTNAPAAATTKVNDLALLSLLATQDQAERDTNGVESHGISSQQGDALDMLFGTLDSTFEGI
jgi:hypothetical protein